MTAAADPGRAPALPTNRPVPAGAAAKRLMDVAGALLLCALLLPLLLLLVLALRLDSTGPALFRQQRIGRNGRAFTMYKLRTMRADADERVHREYVTRLLTGPGPEVVVATGQLYKLQDDVRITRLGRVLRRTSLDELPQLLNVLRGEMSLVGPRPSLPYEAELMAPRHRQRFRVRPGITGLWQVSGRNRVTMLDALDLDVKYVEEWSLRADLRILLRTAAAVCRPTCR